MNDNLAQKAISHALDGEWDKAIKINLQLLKTNSKNTDALNRLAKAYAEIGKITKAKECAKKVLKQDPYNSIAAKCLDKWTGLTVSKITPGGSTSVDVFIEQPGKTKMVELMHVSCQKLLAQLDCGDKLKLNPHGHRISVVSLDGKYVGRIPDNIGSRIKQLLNMGKEYDVFIKSITKEHVKIFIKEIFTPKNIADIQSFPLEKIEYVSFTSPELVHKKAQNSNDTFEQED